MGMVALVVRARGHACSCLGIPPSDHARPPQAPTSVLTIRGHTHPHVTGPRLSSRSSREDLLQGGAGVGSPGDRDRFDSTASSLDSAMYRRQRGQSTRDRLRLKPKRAQGFLRGLNFPVSFFTMDDPALDTLGTVVRTAPLMHWAPTANGLSPAMSNEMSNGKLRAVILTDQCVLVAKWKGDLKTFNLKGVIKLGCAILSPLFIVIPARTSHDILECVRAHTRVHHS